MLARCRSNVTLVEVDYASLLVIGREIISNKQATHTVNQLSLQCSLFRPGDERGRDGSGEHSTVGD